MVEPGWENGSQTLRSILNKQGEKIKLEVQHFLTETPNLSEEDVKVNISKGETDLWDRFALGEARGQLTESLEERQAQTWAEVAKNAQRGVRRTLKDLPELPEDGGDSIGKSAFPFP